MTDLRSTELKKIGIMIAAMSLACLCACTTGGTTCTPYLRPAEFEAITAIHDFRIKDYDPLLVNGNINVVDSSGVVLLSVRIFDAADYEMFKKVSFKRVVSGIGEEAFVMPREGPEYGIFYKKKACAVSVIGGSRDFGGPPLLTIGQLTQIATLLASRSE
jgi:hypothetical protein